MACAGKLRHSIPAVIISARLVLLCLCFSTQSKCFQRPDVPQSFDSLSCVSLVARIRMLRLRGGSQRESGTRPTGSEGESKTNEEETTPNPEHAWSAVRKPWGDCGDIPGMHADEALKRVKVLSPPIKICAVWT